MGKNPCDNLWRSRLRARCFFPALRSRHVRNPSDFSGHRQAKEACAEPRGPRKRPLSRSGHITKPGDFTSHPLAKAATWASVGHKTSALSGGRARNQAFSGHGQAMKASWASLGMAAWAEKPAGAKSPVSFWPKRCMARCLRAKNRWYQESAWCRQPPTACPLGQPGPRNVWS